MSTGDTSPEQSHSEAPPVSKLNWLNELFTYKPGHIGSIVFLIVGGSIASLYIFDWSTQSWRLLVLVGILLIWVLIQNYVYVHYKNKPPLLFAVGALLFQLGLLEIIIWQNISQSLIFLYLFIPLRGLVYFGEGIGIIISMATWLAFALHLFSFTLPNEAYYSNLFAFTLILIFLVGRGRANLHEEAQRQRNRELLNQLELSNRQLQAYSEQVEELSATKERNRIARDIHDSVGHYLTAMNIQIETALVLQKNDPQETQAALEALQQLGKQAILEVRQTVATLRQDQKIPSLGQALQEMIERVDQLSPFKIALEVVGPEEGLTNQGRLILQRVAQEGLTNIQKYAAASQVKVRLEFQPKEIWLEIKDDGKGFEPANLVTIGQIQRAGYGLQGIRERLDLSGGHLDLLSSPGNGTTLRARLPRSPFQSVEHEAASVLI